MKIKEFQLKYGTKSTTTTAGAQRVALQTMSEPDLEKIELIEFEELELCRGVIEELQYQIKVITEAFKG